MALVAFTTHIPSLSTHDPSLSSCSALVLLGLHGCFVVTAGQALQGELGDINTMQDNLNTHVDVAEVRLLATL